LSKPLFITVRSICLEVLQLYLKNACKNYAACGTLFIGPIRIILTVMLIRKILPVILLGVLTIVSCNDGNDRNDPELKDPLKTHSPAQAIPESTRLVNDSVIVPDTTR